MKETLPYTFKLTLYNRFKTSMAGVCMLVLGAGILAVAYPTKELLSISVAVLFMLMGIGLAYLMLSRPSTSLLVTDEGIFLAYALKNLQRTISWDDIIGFSKVSYKKQEQLVIQTKSAKAKVENDTASGMANYAAGMIAKGADAPGISIPDTWLGMKVDKAIEILECFHKMKTQSQS